MLEKGEYSLAATKRYHGKTDQIKNRIDIGFPSIKDLDSASYFVEIQDELHTNKKFNDPNQALAEMNDRLL